MTTAGAASLTIGANVRWISARDAGARLVMGCCAAAGGTDDAAGHRLADAERIANREHHIADLEFVAVREFNRGQVRAIDLQHGDVGLRIFADNLGRKFASITERHLHLVGVFHDVIVGEQITVLGDDHAGAKPVLFGHGHIAPASAEESIKVVTEKAPQPRIVRKLIRQLMCGILDRAGDVNPDDAGRDLLHDGRKAGNACFARHRLFTDGQLYRRRFCAFPGLQLSPRERACAAREQNRDDDGAEADQPLPVLCVI